MQSRKISLKACRINKNFSLKEATQVISKQTGIKISRQRLSNYENNPESIPPLWAKTLSDAYDIPMDFINFNQPKVIN